MQFKMQFKGLYTIELDSCTCSCNRIMSQTFKFKEATHI